MLALTLFGIALLGTMIWVVSPEAAVALYASQRRWHPLVIGLLAASGQVAAQALLYAFGHQLRRRWRWFDRQCESVRRRYGQRLQGGVVALAATSGLVGFPPISVVATLAPGLGLRATRLLPLTFVARVVRFTVLAAAALRVIPN
jgi:membrane protein YqaA with SNARE-associated domain